MITRYQTKDSIFITLNALIVVALGAMFFLFPRALDDYWYMADVDACARSGGDYDFWSGVLGCWKMHWADDNSRLANMVGAIVIHLPRWVTAAVSTVAVAYALRHAYTLAGCTARSVGAYTLIAAAFVFALPWGDGMFSTMFAISYVWTLPVMLWTINVFLNCHRRRPGEMFVVGLLLGAWHESFSFPLLCGAVAVMALWPSRLRSDRVWLCVGLLLGGLWLITSPSVLNRTGYWHRIHPRDSDAWTLYHHIATAVFIVLEIIALARRRWRTAACSPLIVIVLSYGLICAVVEWSTVTMRAAFPCFIISYIGIAYLLRNMLPQVFDGRNRWIYALSAVVWCAILLNLSTAVYATAVISRQEDEIVEAYEAKPDDGEPLFAEISFARDFPWWAMGKPYFDLYTYYWHSGNMSQYYGRRHLDIVPRILKQYRGEGVPVGGNAGFKAWNGVLVAPADSCLTAPDTPGFIDSGTARPRETLYLVRFTGADGNPYVYLAPSERLASDADVWRSVSVWARTKPGYPDITRIENPPYSSR